MNKLKISAVSYTNTKPFIYGLQHSGLLDVIDLSLDIPTECAQKLIDGTVDIGLIPVASIPDVPGAQIISNYCIGSEGAVNSVFIFSHVPVHTIKSVKLDPQSRTSNNLAKILLKNHWQVNPIFLTGIEGQTDAIVLIGDRTFSGREAYKYAYDLGSEWLKFTGLPFVYAAWVANKPVSNDFIERFNMALKNGLEHRNDLLQTLPQIPGFDLNDYLLNKLNFDLTDKKRQALKLFLELKDKLDTSPKS